jgi:hypothetical protein
VGRTVRTMAGPPALYYLAIDGTDAQDAAIFGALLEGRGWKNLATTFLKPAPDDPGRLVDPVHPFLPIPLVEAKGKKIAVVAPGGRDGKGLDGFWQRYKGEEIVGQRPVRGRHAAAELSADFMRHLIMTPAIHSHELAPGKMSRHFADIQRAFAGKHAATARILYISSHGWLSGRMEGDVLGESRAAEPLEAQEAYFPSARYFSLGKVVNAGWGFHGPEWIVLAQCSTLNSASWPLWARLLGNSSPGVRGILAYEEVAPAAKPATQIAETFFGQLDAGSSFLDAWVQANRGQRWAAIVHKNARNDTLKALPRFSGLADVDTSEDRASYRGYMTSLGPNGESIYDREPPLRLLLAHHAPGGPKEITPANVGDYDCDLAPGRRYSLFVSAPEEALINKASITVVHIRRSHTRQFNWGDLFVAEKQENGVKLSGLDSKTVTITPWTPLSSTALHVRARDPLPAGLVRAHAYLWFRVETMTSAGRFQHDFTTRGLEF